MPNMLDYLTWRGDLSFKQDPFNEVDNLILSQIAYLDLSGVVPAPGEGEPVTVAQAWQRFARRCAEQNNDGAPGGVVSNLTPQVLELMARSSRFGRALMANYVDIVDAAESLQFSALTVQLEDRSTYVAFRGTDASFAGWREDFAMSFSTVPAQICARGYLEDVRKTTRGPLRVGGHSKGGNLAVFATARATKRTQRRIIEVWSNDGPGFAEGVLPDQGLDAIHDKARLLVPESCVVGQLLEQDLDKTVVASSGVGILQHDAMAWQVQGKRFVALEQTSEGSQRFGEVFASLIKDKDLAWRSRLTESLFTALEAGGSSIDELRAGGVQAYLKVARAYLEVEPQYRQACDAIVRALMGQALSQGLAEAGGGLADAALGLLGVPSA